MRIFTIFILMLLVLSDVISNAQDSWNQKANFGGTKRTAATGFSIGRKGYLGTGHQLNGLPLKDFWCYDQETDTWSQIADFGGNERFSAVAFSIGEKGYAGTGIGASYKIKKDFWEYDPSANTWTQIKDFAGTARYEAVAFAAGGKGYVGTGFDLVAFPLTTNTFYEYNPQTNHWIQIDDLPASPRAGAAAFSIDEKGYVGTGNDNNFNYYKDFWEYNPATGGWSPIADFGGTQRQRAAAFSLDGKGYIGAGYDSPNGFRNDFWQYDPVSNQWFNMGVIGTSGVRESSVGLTIGNKGYIGLGDYSVLMYDDFWEYTPPCPAPELLSVTSIAVSSARISWMESNNNYGYKVRYKVAGTSAWINVQSLDNDKTLTGLMAATEYVWQVKSICAVDPIVSSAWSEKQFFTTSSLKLSNEGGFQLEISPNPFSSATTISFSLQQTSHTTITLLDVAGRKIKTLLDENEGEGNHEVNLSVRSPWDNRESLGAGIYFLQLKMNNELVVKKVVVEYK